ncbi:hypothetical protein F4780DRAFT_782610 [Xylariomycetidae sp. FL0641]|nr:hypothetical protein F4780DRAFT_782610 [Xylariomycetidae sp. FL0641]
MPSLFGKIKAKIELHRLEQRYTRNRHRRSTFMSNALYVDGEYVYQTPNVTGSSTNSGSLASSPIQEEAPTMLRRSFDEPGSPTHLAEPQTLAEKKRRNRFSAMPSFASFVSSKNSQPDWRQNGVDVSEVR